jgi:hypothetical protein
MIVTNFYRHQVITLSFRGSLTLRDWKANSNVLMAFVPDPTLELNDDDDDGDQTDAPPDVGIYAGFMEYLFDEEDKEEDDDGTSKTSKYESAFDALRTALEQNPGFQVRATGHSMGGSLASIFSFFALTCGEDWVPPIECITFGAPRFGDIGFFYAFRRLELAGRISKLRVVNNEDLIHTLPDRWACVQRTTYHHVGIELRLFMDDAADSKPVFHVPQAHKSGWHRFYYDFIKIIRRIAAVLWLFLNWVKEGVTPVAWILSKHSCVEYRDRTRKKHSKEHLTSVKLSDLTGSIITGKFPTEREDTVMKRE